MKPSDGDVSTVNPPAAREPKLLDRVRAAIRTRHYSRRTEEAYVHWTRRFIVFHGKRHPSAMGAAEMSSSSTVTPWRGCRRSTNETRLA
jgi:hypothetical protein